MNIFECKVPMPKQREGVVAVAQVQAESHLKPLPDVYHNPDMAVRSAPSPKIGKD